MNPDEKLTSLGQFIDRLDEAAEGSERVTLRAVVEAAGHRSFAPLLLLAGLIALSPLAGIPGVPTTVAVLVALTAGQFLFRRRHVWLPRWRMNRSLSRDHFKKVLRVMRRPAQRIDRVLRPRLTVLTHHASLYVIAAICIVIAAMLPPMEIIPFTAHAAGAALTAFALSLITHDGLVALLALVLTGVAGGFLVHGLLT